MLNFNGSLINTVKPKAKHRYRSAVMFYTIQKCINKVVYFSKIYYYAKFQDPTLIGADSVPPNKFARPPCWNH